MADDTRQSTTASPAPTAYPAPTAQDTAQEAVRYRTPANSLPGGTAHTAGGEKFDDESLITKAVRTIKPEDFLNVPYQPCAKDSLMTGMLSGFAMGGLMGIVGRKRLLFIHIPISRRERHLIGTRRQNGR
jgi:cytochrome c oxidase assembly protein subunit 20